MAESCSSGIWFLEPVGPFHHMMISHDALDLPSELARRFDAWILKYQDYLDDPAFDWPAFNREGRRLAQDLKDYMGMAVYVEHIMEPEQDYSFLESVEITLSGLE